MSSFEPDTSTAGKDHTIKRKQPPSASTSVVNPYSKKPKNPPILTLDSSNDKQPPFASTSVVNPYSKKPKNPPILTLDSSDDEDDPEDTKAPAVSTALWAVHMSKSEGDNYVPNPDCNCMNCLKYRNELDKTRMHAMCRAAWNLSDRSALPPSAAGNLSAKGNFKVLKSGIPIRSETAAFIPFPAAAAGVNINRIDPPSPVTFSTPAESGTDGAFATLDVSRPPSNTARRAHYQSNIVSLEVNGGVEEAVVADTLPVPAVTPEKKKSGGTRTGVLNLQKAKATVPPMGPYSRGSQGPDSVLDPIVYSCNLSNEDRQLLDQLRRTSGQLQLVRAAFNPDADNPAHDGDGNQVPPILGLDGGAENPNELASLQDMRAAGVDTNQVLLGISQFLSPVVQTSLMNPMMSIGVYNIDSMANVLRQSKTGGTEVASNAKVSVLFIPFMVRNKHFSLYNGKNQSEFYYVRGEKKYYRNFWSDQLEIKNRPNEGTFSNIDIGMFQPKWSIPNDQLQDHEEALAWMRANGPIVPGSKDLVILNLKQTYAYIFLIAMKSSLVIQARLAGYQPVFLLKNALIQRSYNFGVNGYQFSSLDKRPKSYLALVGFSKGTTEDHDFSLITLTNRRNELLTIRDA
jgi:hypothetical protein